MYQNGRTIGSDIADDERLFFRCVKESVDSNNRIKPASVRFPDQSVNREQFSRPGDVLLPDGETRSKEWILNGVVAFFRNDLPCQSSSGGDVTYTFTAEHDPVEDNYGHTELRVYKDGRRVLKSKQVNTEVKKRYRLQLARKAQVIIRPLI